MDPWLIYILNSLPAITRRNEWLLRGLQPTKARIKRAFGLHKPMKSLAVIVLETEVGESFVGLSHTVDFITLLHGTATAFRGFHQLVGQTQGH